MRSFCAWDRLPLENVSHTILRCTGVFHAVGPPKVRARVFEVWANTLEIVSSLEIVPRSTLHLHRFALFAVASYDFNSWLEVVPLVFLTRFCVYTLAVCGLQRCRSTHVSAWLTRFQLAYLSVARGG